MGRQKGGKNKRYSVEYKEEIIKEYLNSNNGLRFYERKYDIAYSVLHKWYDSYQKEGRKGLISKTGKHKSAKRGKHKRNKTEVDKLKEELLKKEIELMRLKKGYMVKGAGVKKEYVSISDLNMK